MVEWEDHFRRLGWPQRNDEGLRLIYINRNALAFRFILIGNLMKEIEDNSGTMTFGDIRSGSSCSDLVKVLYIMVDISNSICIHRMLPP